MFHRSQCEMSVNGFSYLLSSLNRLGCDAKQHNVTHKVFLAVFFLITAVDVSFVGHGPTELAANRFQWNISLFPILIRSTFNRLFRPPSNSYSSSQVAQAEPWAALAVDSVASPRSVRP